MHIMLIHQAFAALDEAGGTRHHELARYLVEQGHRVTIVASPVNYLTGTSKMKRTPWIERQEIDPGITVLRSYTYAAFHKSFVHRVFSFISFMVSSFIAGLGVRQVDLVWGTSPPIFQGLTAWLLSRLKRVPFLFEVRDLWPAFAIAVGVLRSPILVWASLRLESFLYRRASRIMVNSPGFIEHVIQRGARWVELVPNGADPEMFDPCSTGSQFRQEYRLDGQFVVLYAGAHGLSNDLQVVLEAAKRLEGNPAVTFVFVGDGKEKKNLVDQAQKMTLGNVLFLPPVPKDQISEIMAAADACVAILKPLEMYKTTYPNKVFDYMAAGRPVVLAIDGVIRQVVEDAQAGIYVPPGSAAALADAVEQLASNPIQARSMGQSGRRMIEKHFNRHSLAEKLGLLIEEMRGEHG